MRTELKMAMVRTARHRRRLTSKYFDLFQFIYHSPQQARGPNGAGQGYSFKMST